MRLIMHYPQTSQDFQRLKEQAAHIHADAVIKYLVTQAYPTKQKLELLSAIKKEIK